MLLVGPVGAESQASSYLGTLTPDKIQQLAKNLLATKYLTVVSFIILLHEHIITLPLEVERIWKQPRSLASLLFCLNRYGTLCQLTVLLFAFNQSWSEQVCSSWFRFAPGLCVISIGFAECILILRTYALYCRDKLVLLGLLILFSVQMGIMGYCVSITTYLRLTSPFTGCIPIIGRMPMGVAFYIAPLVTDGVIFALTVIKTARYLRTNVRTALPRIVLRDGIIHFVLIVGINLMNVLVFVTAPITLKALGTSLSQVITTILISRLQLNLLGESLRRTRAPLQRPDYSNAKQLSIEMRQVALASFSNETAAPPPPPPVFSSRNLARMFNAPPSAGIIGAPIMAAYFPPPSMSYYRPVPVPGPGPIALGSRSPTRAGFSTPRKQRWCEEPNDEATRLQPAGQDEDVQPEPSWTYPARGLDSTATTSDRKPPRDHPPNWTDNHRLTQGAALSNRPPVPVSRVHLDGRRASSSGVP